MDPPSPPHELTAPKIFINDHEFVDHEFDDDDNDIYRGDRSSTPQSTELGSATSLKSFSTASSGSFRLAGGRLGVLATHLERAITRWARRNWGDSSSSITSSSSSESSRSSFRTANKSSRRRRRPPSLADIQLREESERAVAARIRAREIGRVVPREFNLYAPPPSSSPDAGGSTDEEPRVVRTFVLDAMLPHLNPLFRNSGKHRRSRQRSRIPRTGLDQHHHLHPQRVHSAKDESSDASRTDAPRGPSLTVEKGKDKASTTRPPDPVQTASTSRRDPIGGKPQQAWWLDVSSPSWEDMKTLGRLLHLHPLTLEDILQREPREKFELFPKLGYYFIIFRAVESSTRNERLDTRSQKTGSSQLTVQGVADETCIYLVVFRDGICTFHFSNISDHLDRVHGKLQTASQTARRSSAWIAHGILDSVVDSFFPLVEEIEEHVTAIETIVHNEDNPASTISPIPPSHTRALRVVAAGEAIPPADTWSLRAVPTGKKVVPVISIVDEKHAFSRDVASVKTAVTQFSLPRMTFGLMLRRWRRAISHFVGFCMRNKPRMVKPSFTGASIDLHRMARTRRLATSVARVLATKPEVIAGIRKRLMASDNPDAGDDVEVAIYFGDVQDHILTLQQSLAHYERMLSESHPLYLQNLHIDLERARIKREFSMFVLALVTVVSTPPLVIIGIVSMNVTVPQNTNGELWIFGVVLAIVLCIQIFFLGLVRYWWVNARRGVKLE